MTSFIRGDSILLYLVCGPNFLILYVEFFQRVSNMMKLEISLNLFENGKKFNPDRLTLDEDSGGCWQKY